MQASDAKTSLEMGFSQLSPFLVFTKAVEVKTRIYTATSKRPWGQRDHSFICQVCFSLSKEIPVREQRSPPLAPTLPHLGGHP